MSVVTVHSGSQHLLEFSTTFRKTATQQTQEITLGKYGQGYVQMDYSDYMSTNHLCYLKFTINFTENPSFNENQTLILSVTFNVSQIAHTFILHKTNASTLTSDKKIVYESVIYSSSSYNLNFRLYVHEKSKSYVQGEENVGEVIKDMKQLLIDKTHSDLKLVVDDKTFNVHKNILATRNRIFSKMIETDMLEKKTSTIKLSQWDPLIVEQVLSYIYTGACNVTLNPHELFKLSHYLEIKPLQDLCDLYMQSTINIKNLIDTLELANQSQYGLCDLKDAVEKFIRSNKFTLAKDFDYTQYLSNSIDLNNIASILEFSIQFKIENLIQKAITFITLKHEEVMKIAACEQLLISNPHIILKLWQYSLEQNKNPSQEESD